MVLKYFTSCWDSFVCGFLFEVFRIVRVLNYILKNGVFSLKAAVCVMWKSYTIFGNCLRSVSSRSGKGYIVLFIWVKKKVNIGIVCYSKYLCSQSPYAVWTHQV